jgi:hypothetical protein
VDYFTAVIEHLDGSEEMVEMATRELIDNGVLVLMRRDPYGPNQEHLGSWPLVSIKKWTKRYR